MLADEPAQWEPAKSEAMLAALKTGLGKIPGSRLVALGTRPADSLHWFAKMLQPGGADLQGRARAFQSLVGGGMAVEKAAALSGLLQPDESIP